MPKPAIPLLVGNNTLLNQTGAAQRGAGYYTTSVNGGWHTVSADLTDFVGRIYIEATLSAQPTENDWFPVQLSGTQAYQQFPVDPAHLQGDGSNTHGDTVTVGWTFRGNFTFVRARVDRSYLFPVPNDLTTVGLARQILMSV